MFRAYIIFFCLFLAIIFSTSYFAQANQPIRVVLDGSTLQFDVHPTVINGRTMVPMRVIFEAFGAELDWNNTTRTIIATKDDLVIIVIVNDRTMIVNNARITMDVTPVIVEARTLVPLRFVSEAFGADVHWNAATNTVTISSREEIISASATVAISLSEEIISATTINRSEFEYKILDIVNMYRENYGLAPLIWHDGIAAVARAHSQDMARNDFLCHIGSDGSNTSARLAGVNIRYQAWEENLARGQRTPEAVMASWMNSSGHRLSILNPNKTHIGVGFENYFWTQKFVLMQ